MALGAPLEHVRFLVNARYLVGLSGDGRACRIADLRTPHVPAEAVAVLPPATPADVAVTCTADADPFMFVGCSDGSILELKQDMATGAWVCDRVFTDPLGCRVEALHCAAVADRQSAKLFLCVGTSVGAVRLCSKTVHSDVSFALLATVSGHHSEAIAQVLISESVDTGGLLFSSLSAGGYARSWHLPLELPPHDVGGGSGKERSIAAYAPLHVQPPAADRTGADRTGTSSEAQPQQRGTASAASAAQNIRCICTIAHVSGAGSNGFPALLSELIAVGRSAVHQPGLRRNFGQLLVAAHLNNAVSTYDIGALATASGGPVKTTVHPVDGAPATACCVVAAGPSPVADTMLVTGHANGSLQVWAFLQDSRPRPTELLEFE